MLAEVERTLTPVQRIKMLHWLAIAEQQSLSDADLHTLDEQLKSKACLITDVCSIYA